jgi:hypothetical protein
MKESFIKKRFGPDALALLDRIHTILETYAGQGYDLSLRQLYYQLVAANVVENTERSYKNIGNLVSDARLAGLIDWDAIKDRGRECVQPSAWTSPRHIIESAAAGFKIDKWLDQPNYVEVMVEKQALEGVLEPVCDELNIPFTANKGYSSSSAMYEAGQRMADKIEDDKSVHVIYLGDHDPSGIDMTRDIEDRLKMFARYEDGDEFTVTVHRVALNMPQIRVLNPPKNPAKLTDSRATSYIEKFGRSSWELDAIEPRALAKLVRDKVIELRDDDLWESALSRERAMIEELQTLARKSKFK